jgi:PAS domain S-box-containing protein/diguanylate cyclase (GGDEF)-like protein
MTADFHDSHGPHRRTPPGDERSGLRRYQWPMLANLSAAQVPADSGVDWLGQGGETGDDVAARDRQLMASWADELARHNELVVSEERYRLLAANSTDMICLADAQWRLSFVSPAARQLLGVAAGALRGARLIDYVPALGRRPVEDALEDAVARSTPTCTLTHELVRADGSRVSAETVFRLTFNQRGGLVSVQSATRDVSARVEAERLAATTQATLAAALERSPVATGVGDRDGRWIHVNPALCRLLGYPAEELLGQPSSAVIHPEDRATALQQRQALMAGQTTWVEADLRYHTADGWVWPGHRTGTILHGPQQRFDRYVIQIEPIPADRRPVGSSPDDGETEELDDAVTGLPGRSVLIHRLYEALSSRVRDRRVGVIVVDLDQFTTINATYGRSAGDHVLHAIGQRLAMVTARRGGVARLDGDRYAILIRDLRDYDELADIADVIHAQIASPVLIDGVASTGNTDELPPGNAAFEPAALSPAPHSICATNAGDDSAAHVGPAAAGSAEEPTPSRQVMLTASVGLALHSDQDAAHLLREAEMAMDRAKRIGGARTYVSSGAVRVPGCPDIDRIATELHAALSTNELELYYQPVVDLGTDRVIGHEALIRWNHPTLGRLNPAQFLPYVEEHDLIGDLGLWVLQRACSATAGDADDGLYVGVNIAANHLAEPDFADQVLDVIAQTGFSPQRLVIEITETSVLHANTTVITTCQRLAAAGIRLALDDFGTGQSSLASLHVLPLHILKIDRSFTAGISTDRSRERLIVGLLQLARAMNLNVIVEGVETKAQEEFLKRHHAAFGQGYLYGQPRPRRGER